MSSLLPPKKETHLPVHAGAASDFVPSPYIVKISYRGGSPVAQVAASSSEEVDVFADEAPLVECRENGALYFVEDGTFAQIAEDVGSLDAPPALLRYPSQRNVSPALLEERLPDPALAYDIFSEFAPEHCREVPVRDDVREDIFDDAQKDVSRSASSDTPEVSLGAGYVVTYADGSAAVTQPVREHLFSPAPLRHRLFHHARATLAFAVFVALVFLPLHASFVFAGAFSVKDRVQEQGETGLSRFLRGAEALEEKDFSSASALFSSSAGAFSTASSSLDEVHAVVRGVFSLIPRTDRTAETADALVTIGERVARASALLAMGIEEASASSALSLTDRLALVLAYVEEAAPDVAAASAASARIDIALVPEDHRAEVVRMIALLPELSSGLTEMLSYGDALQLILGAEAPRTYLLVFQNTAELRATGGFLGSFAEVALDQGALTDVQIPEGGTYDIQGQVRAFVAAPGPLQLLRPRWEFQDANWFPDFPTSARKMLWFYEAAGGPSVDGVLALNSSLLPELLTVLGPLSLEDGTELTSENVLFFLQKYAEVDHREEGTLPKAVIGEVVDALFARLETADISTVLRVAHVFVSAFSTQDMQVYFSDNTLQSTVQRLHWTGALRGASQDYLYAVHTNVGGGKTDTVLTRDMTIDTTFLEDGTIQNTVTLTSTHNGMAASLFSGVNNVDYVRLYVPRGSVFVTGTGFERPQEELFVPASYPLAVDEDLAVMMRDVSLDAQTGTDVWEEQGKTVFGNWVQTAPGETQMVSFTYTLPWRLDVSSSDASLFARASTFLGMRDALSYSMLLQKQSGVSQSVLHRLHVPSSFQVAWNSFDADASSAFSLERFFTSQERDVFTGWIFVP